MLRLVQSNKMEVLAELLIEQLRRHYSTTTLSQVLQPLHILVQSPGMAQWLKLRIADALGVAANIEFPLPSSFIWQLYREHIHDLPAQSAFTKPNMQWKLLQILPLHIERPEFAPIKQYLNTSDAFGAVNQARKLFQLAGKIADVFDQYLVYRPDWIHDWEANSEIRVEMQAPIHSKPLGITDADSQLWQPILWRELVSYAESLGESPWHRANLHRRLLTLLQQHSNTDPSVYIFGISAMPKQQLEIFQALSSTREVVMFWSNPCAQYWGDIVTEKQQSKKQLDMFQQLASAPPQGDSEQVSLDTLVLYETGNPLLASWGKLGREFQDMLYEANNDQIQSEDWFVDPPPSSLLEQLQTDILTLAQPMPLTARSNILADDESIWVNSCHSKLRELEVLHDHLLHRLQRDKTASAGEIIVMMPNVADYAPYIDAVFGGAASEHYLSYAIADRSVVDESPLIQAFLQLLTLHQSRFTLTEVLELFAVPEVLNRFGVQESEQEWLQHWLSQAGVRWGLNGTDKQRWALPDEQQNTWLFGLRRLLAGYALHQQADYVAVSSGTDVQQDIVPFSELEGQQVDILGRFMAFLQQLEQILHSALASATLSERITHAASVLHNLFEVNDQQQYFQQQIVQALETLTAHSAQFPGNTDADVFASAIQQELSSKGVGQRFLAGRINFCTLMPMRSIPFQQVCILGLNDPGYPRIVPPVGFDLMAGQTPRRGDRSRRWDDRYLFLEAILSARSQLYLSYLGRDDRDNSVRAPSILLTELLQYCQRYQPEIASGNESHAKPGAEHALVAINAQPLQPFNAQYFMSDPTTQINANVPSGIKPSFSPRWLQVLQQGESSTLSREAFVRTALLELPDAISAEVSLMQLKACLRNAPRFFFQQRWHTQFRPSVANEDDIEPLGLSSLSRFQMTDRVLRAGSADNIYQQLKLIGELPVANLAQPAQKELQKLSEDVLKQIAKALPGSDLHQYIAQAAETECTWRDVSVDLVVDGKHVRLFGRVHGVYDLNAREQNRSPNLQLLHWRPGRMRVIDPLFLWLDWLLLTAAGSANLTDLAVFAFRKSYLILPPVTQEKALELLTNYVQFWRQAHVQALPFFPDSAWAWLEKQSDESALKCFHGAHYQSDRGAAAPIRDSAYAALPEGSDLHFQRICPDLAAQMPAFQHWSQTLLGELYAALFPPIKP